jgi:hypothetical protein
MNESREIWSLPWHALQRDLAVRLNVDLIGRSLPTINASVLGVTLTAKTWLSRVQRPALQPVPLRQ